MVLLDNVVEVFALSDHDLGALLPIVVLDSGVVRAALVDVDDLGKAVVLDGAREEAPCRTTITFGGQQEVDGVPLLINRAIPIPVLAADLDVRLVQAPTLADRADAPFALPFTEGFLQDRDQLGPSGESWNDRRTGRALASSLRDCADSTGRRCTT